MGGVISSNEEEETSFWVLFVLMSLWMGTLVVAYMRFWLKIWKTRRIAFEKAEKIRKEEEEIEATKTANILRDLAALKSLTPKIIEVKAYPLKAAQQAPPPLIVPNFDGMTLDKVGRVLIKNLDPENDQLGRDHFDDDATAPGRLEPREINKPYISREEHELEIEVSEDLESQSPEPRMSRMSVGQGDDDGPPNVVPESQV